MANGDYVWIEEGEPALHMVADAWDPARMDSCLIVVPKDRTLGFDTPGDFFLGPDQNLEHRDGRPGAPLHCFGVQILDPTLAYAVPETRFSLFQVWMQAASSEAGSPTCIQKPPGTTPLSRPLAAACIQTRNSENLVSGTA